MRVQSFAELRPMVRWEALAFKVPGRIESTRIARRPAPGWHVVNLRTADEVDADVRD